MSIDSIRRSLHDAVLAANAACFALSRSDAPFARVLLREAQEGTAKLRNSRDMLAAALLEVGKNTTKTTQIDE